MLTDRRVQALKPDDKKIADGNVPGLWLVPGSIKGQGRWVFRFVSPATKKRRDMGLGSYPDISIAKAREFAQAARTSMAIGIDPIDARKDFRKDQNKPKLNRTFEVAARTYYDQHKDGWKNGKHVNQWINTLEQYAFPTIGSHAVDLLELEDFRRILEPIWLTNSETASRVKQRCHRIMQWCVQRKYCSHNPVSGVELSLPKMKKKRLRSVNFPSMPYEAIGEFTQRVLRDGTYGSCRDAIEFLILSAVRSGELRQLRWSQVNLEAKIWSIPAEHMKSGMSHKVPLTTRMLEILSLRLNGRSPSDLEDDLVFPAPRGGTYSDTTFSKFLKDHRAISDTAGKFATPHGFRSSFRTWGAENSHPEHVLEVCLAHTEKNDLITRYRRTDFLDQRMTIMQSWTDYISRISVQGFEIASP